LQTQNGGSTKQGNNYTRTPTPRYIYMYTAIKVSFLYNFIQLWSLFLGISDLKEFFESAMATKNFKNYTLRKGVKKWQFSFFL
jgi:hypothetical protein